MSDSEKSPEQLYNTGIAYVVGNGVVQDSAKGAAMLKEAADMDYLPAVRDLGILYLNGDGVEADYQKAFELISKTAAKMDVNSIYHLALMYEYGKGVEQDLYQALKMMAFCVAANFSGADTDADRIEDKLDAQRNANINARPILNLDISDVDIEACCCKPMLDAVRNKDIYTDDTFEGPKLFGADEQGNEIVLDKCPFCGKVPRIVPHDKVY